MKVIRILLVLALAAGIGASAHALTLDEHTLASTGFNGLSILTPGETDCATLTFVPAPDAHEAGNDTVLSFTWNVFPLTEQDGNVVITEKSTNEIIDVISPRDRLSNNRVHVLIPPRLLNEPQTQLAICGTASFSTDEFTILGDGAIGLYQQPRFDGKTNFQTLVAGTNPQLGDDIAIQVFLTNTGSQPGDVKIDYRKYDLDYIPLLKGQTGFSGTIEPGEQKQITFMIKPLRAVQILLPPAVLTYTNIFGEEVVQESTRAYLEVAAPEFNVKGAFLVPQTQVNVNEPVTVRWVAQNEGIVSLHNLHAAFTVQPDGLISPPTAGIDTLSPSAAESREFSITFAKAGTYTIGCHITTLDDPAATTNCQSATIEVVENSGLIPLVFSVVLLLIAVGVYAYISIAPQKKAEADKPPRKRFQSDD